MALVTVFETLGSTYSKSGHRTLIAANGDYQGLISGGCLEGDLAERACRAVEQGRPTAVTYDLRDEADELFGLGVGCNGLIRVFLQPLLPDSGYEPFAAIAECLLGDERAAVATVIESDAAATEAGATLVATRAGRRAFGVPDMLAAALGAGCDETIESGRPRLRKESGLTVLYAPIDPVPRILLLGGGLDAVPLVNMAVELGWRVTVADHRPAYVGRAGFAAADAVVLVDSANLSESLDLDRYEAIVVMSHHLTTDERYLAQLAGHATPYLGVLGPPARRERLIEQLGSRAGDLDRRLRGPVGLDIGADAPESIALSILAEIQQTLAARQVRR